MQDIAMVLHIAEIVSRPPGLEKQMLLTFRRIEPGSPGPFLANYLNKIKKAT